MHSGFLSARVLIFLISLIQIIFSGIEIFLETKQQKRPLPLAVANIYDKERYKSFIARESELRRIGYIHTVVSSVLEFIVLFSPVFSFVERIAHGNVYAIVVIMYFMYWILGRITGIPYNYYYTFHIDEKYGLNKMTKREFVKDKFLSDIQQIFLVLGILLIVAFCGEHMSAWTDSFSVSWGKTIAVAGIIAVIVFLFVVVAQLFSYFVLRKQYDFTPLPDGELRNKIVALMSGCKKKVSEIYVYNESKKSTEKNAFLLKLFWHREFGIADNFINENAERELLAVLSHEIGHLKHKKNLLDYIRWAITGLIVVAIIVLIHFPSPIFWITAWTRESFQLTVNNYYLIISVLSSIITPILFCTKVYGNFKSRRNEHEADMEAVKNGFGEDLISTFEKLSSDELVDVNPHPFIEMVEYSHPGMYHRISYIREESSRVAEGRG